MNMNIEKELFNFFMWFRENGVLHVNKSIEQMIKIYIETK